MRILIIKGSPHINGTTNTIVNEFIKVLKKIIQLKFMMLDTAIFTHV